MTETSYHADPASVVFIAPESGSLLAGTNWRRRGELCPPLATDSRPTPVQGMTGRMGDVRRIAAFAIKHDVPGLTAWSPPI